MDDAIEPAPEPAKTIPLAQLIERREQLLRDRATYANIVTQIDGAVTVLNGLINEGS